MKKPYRHDEVSNVVCSVCGRPLKRNVVERKENKPDKCYRCYVNSLTKVDPNPYYLPKG